MIGDHKIEKLSDGKNFSLGLTISINLILLLLTGIHTYVLHVYGKYSAISIAINPGAVVLFGLGFTTLYFLGASLYYAYESLTAKRAKGEAVTKCLFNFVSAILVCLCFLSFMGTFSFSLPIFIALLSTASFISMGVEIFWKVFPSSTILSCEKTPLVQSPISTEDQMESSKITSDNISTLESAPSIPAIIPIPILIPIKRCGIKEDKLSKPIITQLCKEHNLQTGGAIDTGDCFFDAFAQGLEINGITIPATKPHAQQLSYKKLRMLCSDFLNQDHDAWPTWLAQSLASDHSAKNLFGSLDSLEQLCARIQYTSQEMDDLRGKEKMGGGSGAGWLPIWGRPIIEGRIICTCLPVSLHVIDLVDFYNETAHEDTLICVHKLINAKDSADVDESAIDYRNQNIVHIICYRSHYAPLLPDQSLVSETEEDEQKRPLPSIS